MDAQIAISDASFQLSQIEQALRQHQLEKARSIADDLTQTHPEMVDSWIASARIFMASGSFQQAREHLAQALERAPGSPMIRLMNCEALIHLGLIKEAGLALNDMEEDAQQDPAWLSRISEASSQCGDHKGAVRCARRAAELNPTEPAIRYNLASTLIATGDLEESERHFDALIASTPNDFDAYYNRATLRRQTPERNHVDEIQAHLERSGINGPGAVQLNYALAKELEDLGKHDASFEALRRGADARRKMMAYKVESDVSVMDQIAKRFDADFFANAPEGKCGKGPIFVLGLPRSGTTLVDRILSAHTDVESFGEINDFALALTGMCRAEGGKSGLVEAAARLDMRALGQAYLDRTAQRADTPGYFIDKTPANFLYIGLIAAALPDARIVHVNRDPMDNGLGMYKTLFRMGYPFSYDQGDLAAYMNAKSTLMRHWRTVLPGRVIDIDYESIVADQEPETRALLTQVGLDWQAECLDFHKNASPTATASAAQVRQPLYKRAVGRWKRYERGLAPLARGLGLRS